MLRFLLLITSTRNHKASPNKLHELCFSLFCSRLMHALASLLRVGLSDFSRRLFSLIALDDTGHDAINKVFR